MAESILRLKVSSEEYDNKLKRATEQLTRYADGCRKVGGTLQYVDDNVVEFARSLGRMETTATTARGKVSELTKAYTELAVQYKNMTDEEKKGEYGKALAASLDQLKGRIGESKTQLDDINKSINGGGGLTGALDNLAGKFGMSVQSLASWGTALAAAKGALDVAKDAFFASEATVDEWGRVMDSSKSLYEGFLTALNTGDISGYLSRIDSIVQAARAAYNELDRLGTMKTIQAPQMSAQQTENERMRMMIQTGRYIAPVDGRKASMQNGQLLTPEQIKRIEQQLQGGMQKVVTLVGNEVAQTSRAIDAVYNRQAQELGMNLNEFRKGTSSMAEFDKRMAGYDQYQKWRAEHTSIDMKSGRETVARGNPFEQFAKWGTFRVDGERYNDLVKLIQQRDQQAGQAYSMQSQAYRTMNRAEGVTLRQIMGGGSGGGRSGGGSKNNIPTLADFDKALGKSLKNSDMLKESKEMLSPFAMLTDEAKKQMLGLADATEDLGGAMAALGEKNVVEEMQKMAKQGMSVKESWELAASAVSLVGQALSGIQDPAAQIMATIAMAIANVAAAYADTMLKDEPSKSNIYAFIAAAAAATVSMVSTIASIHQATGYARGGVIKAANGAAIPGTFTVPGTTYSNDQIPAMLNAGETVLTRAQAGNIASQLQGAGGSINLNGVLTGENIFLSADRYARRSGRGELVTFHR